MTSRVLALLLALSSLSFSQSEAGGASLGGTVTDPSGAVVPAVSIKATNGDTGLVRETVTNTDGVYSLVRLPVGKYKVEATANGFRKAVYEDLRLSVGAVGELDIKLAVGSTADSVTVTTGLPVVETTRSQTSTVVDEKLVRDLPINGRNYLDFTTLSPGVVRDPRGGDLSFGGQRGTMNSFLVDGTDSNNLFFGQSTGRQGTRNPYAVSQDAVQEFQVNTNGFAAEIGRAGGGVVNVITKSGSNDIHGGVFFYYRDTNLNANNAFNKGAGRARAPYKFKQFGANVGGPLVKDKLFYFFNYDGQRNKEPIVMVPPPGVVALLPTLSPAAQAAYQSLITNYYSDYSRGLNNDVYLFKTDWLASSKDTLTFRWNANRFKGTNFENASATRNVGATGDSKVTTDSLAIGYTRLLGATRVWETRYNLTRDDEPGEANSDKPETTVQQAAQTIVTFGRNNFSPRYTNSKRNQIISTVSQTWGKHTMKFGGDLNFERIINFFPGQFSGVYTFTSLQDFADNRPATFAQALAGPNTTGATTKPNINEVAFFIQDQFRATSRLTLNYGLRYDLNVTAKPPVRNTDPQLIGAGYLTDRLDVDKNNVGPRFGAAYRVLPNSDKLVVRGGWGLFYGRTPSILIGTVHSNNGIAVQNYSFTGAAVPVTYPNILAGIPSTGRLPVNVFVMAPNYQLAQTQQFSLNVEGQVAGAAVTVGYLGVRGSHLTRSRDVNLSPMTLQTGTLCATANTAACDSPAPFSYYRHTGARPLTAFNRVTQVDSEAASNYNGVFFQFSRRYAKSFQVQSSYTFSKVIDTAPEATAVLPNNGGDDVKIAWDTLNPDLDRGLGDADIRHRFVFSGVWDINYFDKRGPKAVQYVAGGWQLSSIFQAQSGRVFSQRVNLDVTNDGNIANERVPFVGRNTLRLPKFTTVDLRVTKDIPVLGDGRVRIRLIGEAFNLFNRANITGQNGVRLNTNLTTFQFRPNAPYLFTTSTGDPRILQLAAKIIF
jgi:hypothetical protein